MAWLPEPERHPLWADIVRLLEPGVFVAQPVIDTNDWVWIIYDGPVLYGAAATRLFGDGEARVMLVGGFQLPKWIGLLSETVSDWAHSGGATKLTSRGRKGWARFAKRFGWVALGKDTDNLTIYEKDLGHG